ncbi:MAG: hypothetical protein LBQ91_05900, partial [Oscillospiraceae bacterium]|nr:hypothetical protein [Oscillospiraceae bacterium]
RSPRPPQLSLGGYALHCSTAVARHKKDLLLSKRSRPFLGTMSGEAEKVTAATHSGTSAWPPATAVNKQKAKLS